MEQATALVLALDEAALEDKQEKVVAIVSGGMDSVTMLHKLVAEGNDVEAISFNYGQRHSKELDLAAYNARTLGVGHKVVEMAFMAELLSNSALTGDIEVPEGHYQAENMKLTVVPNRNMIMGAIAIGYAVNLEYDAVAMGIHAGDHAIYPDCRPEFAKKFDAVARIANYKEIRLRAPYIASNKTEIIKEGLELGVDYAKTWTCYKGRELACGVCGSCQERLEAFANNGIEDPLNYE